MTKKIVIVLVATLFAGVLSGISWYELSYVSKICNANYNHLFWWIIGFTASCIVLPSWKKIKFEEDDDMAKYTWALIVIAGIISLVCFGILHLIFGNEIIEKWSQEIFSVGILSTIFMILFSIVCTISADKTYAGIMAGALIGIECSMMRFIEEGIMAHQWNPLNIYITLLTIGLIIGFSYTRNLRKKDPKIIENNDDYEPPKKAVKTTKPITQTTTSLRIHQSYSPTNIKKKMTKKEKQDANKKKKRKQNNNQKRN